MGALPAQSRELLAPCDHQTRSRSNASRCIRCGHGGGNLGGCATAPTDTGSEHSASELEMQPRRRQKRARAFLDDGGQIMYNSVPIAGSWGHGMHGSAGGGRPEDSLGHVKWLPPGEQMRPTERLARASAARQNEGSD
eukprot:COSAG01_NODE_4722_length_4768_cov_29.755115_1_plen_138_part_00